MKQQINIRLDEEQLRSIDAEAKEQRRTRTNMIEFIVGKYLSGKKEQG